MSVIDGMFEDEKQPTGDGRGHLQWYPASSWRCWCSGRSACHPSASGWPSCRRGSGPAAEEKSHDFSQTFNTLPCVCAHAEKMLLRIVWFLLKAGDVVAMDTVRLTMRGEDLSMLITVRLTRRRSRSIISWTWPLVGPCTGTTATITHIPYTLKRKLNDLFLHLQ